MAKKYSGIEDIMKQQRRYCDLLKAVTEVVFGLDEVNRELVADVTASLEYLSSGTESLRYLLTDLKKGNEELKDAISTVETHADFLETLENHPDFQRLFCTVEKDQVASEKRPTKKRVACILEITALELETVPFYVKGRIKMEDINEFISSVNATVVKKYSIVRGQTDLKYKEKLLQQQYKAQERLCPGLTFFTEEDLKQFGFLRTSIPVSKLLNILRAVQRLKELRSDGFVRYVVVTDGTCNTPKK